MDNTKEYHPGNNLLEITKTQADRLTHKHLKRTMLMLPKSSKYKEYLEPMLGRTVTIRTKEWCFKKMTVHNQDYTRLLILKGTATANNKTLNLPATEVHYLSTLLDKDFLNRNEFEENSELKVKGFIYMHKNKEHRNIGLHTYSVKTTQKKNENSNIPKVENYDFNALLNIM